MSTTLSYTSPARGHLYPMMDVGIAMSQRGHRVVVQTLSGERDRIASEGLRHRPISPALEALQVEDYQGGNPVSQLQRTLDQIFQRADLLRYRTAEPFEYPCATWPKMVRAIGPGLWAPPVKPPTGSTNFRALLVEPYPRPFRACGMQHPPAESL